MNQVDCPIRLGGEQLAPDLNDWLWRQDGVAIDGGRTTGVVTAIKDGHHGQGATFNEAIRNLKRAVEGEG